MSNEINILVLCANYGSINQYKSLNIIYDFCTKTSYLSCSDIKLINIYYAGEKLIDQAGLPPPNKIPNITQNEMIINSHKIIIEHNFLPNELGNIKNDLIPNLFPKFFNIIINENCPRTEREDSYGIQPKFFNSLISQSLSDDGFYIDKDKARQQFGLRGFQILYDPNNTGFGLLEKLEPSIQIESGKENSKWAIYQLRSDLKERKKAAERLQLRSIPQSSLSESSEDLGSRDEELELFRERLRKLREAGKRNTKKRNTKKRNTKKRNTKKNNLDNTKENRCYAIYGTRKDFNALKIRGLNEKKNLIETLKKKGFKPKSVQIKSRKNCKRFPTKY